MLEVEERGQAQLYGIVCRHTVHQGTRVGRLSMWVDAGMWVDTVAEVGGSHFWLLRYS